MKVRRSDREPRDPYRQVTLVLLGGSLFGIFITLIGGYWFINPVMLAAAVGLGLASCLLIGVVQAQNLRSSAFQDKRGSIRSADRQKLKNSASTQPSVSPTDRMWFSILERAVMRGVRTVRDLEVNVRLIAAVLGTSAILLLFFHKFLPKQPSLQQAGIGIAFSFIGAALAAMAARYLANIDPDVFPESVGLCQGARLLTWVFVLVAVSMPLAWANFRSLLQGLYLAVLALDAVVCFSLFQTRNIDKTKQQTFSLDIGLFRILGQRANILASALDAAEQQLGIDLRSTWALTIVRRTLEPLAVCLCLVAWLSTSLTVVGTDEQGIVERLGVTRGRTPYQPGLHTHWPWPIDRVYRIPVQKVQTVQVGHEGEEKEGPEDVLWAVQHAPNEYTLLLGNGRDLITVDAAVQYRIADAHAWSYNCQNPAAALRAIAYRAVMRSTVNLTLSDALSQNVAILTQQMRTMVQQEADHLGLGVEILAFTVGGMHPPVPVAPAYEAVVSAELGKVTAAVDAQAFRNQTVPSAESSVLAGENTARAEGYQSLSTASGQAWSFRTLESQYHAAPEEYRFRRRLEAMEKGLSGKAYTVVDSRFLHDGGEIWMTR